MTFGTCPSAKRQVIHSKDQENPPNLYFLRNGAMRRIASPRHMPAKSAFQPPDKRPLLPAGLLHALRHLPLTVTPISAATPVRNN